MIRSTQISTMHPRTVCVLTPLVRRFEVLGQVFSRTLLLFVVAVASRCSGRHPGSGGPCDPPRSNPHGWTGKQTTEISVSSDSSSPQGFLMLLSCLLSVVVVQDVDVAASARTRSFSWLRKGRFLTNDKFERMQENLSEADRQK